MSSVRGAIRQGAYILAEAGVDSPTPDAKELMESIVGEIFTAPATLSPAQEREFFTLVGKRASRIPLQYLTGKMYFRRRTLKAAEGVFIVRPETEMVAESAIAAAREVARPLGYREGAVRVVDLCAGSGAIAGAVADEIPGAKVWAVEMDPKAYALAKENLQGLQVELVCADATSAETMRNLDGSIDVVVSNPPYVPEGDVAQAEALCDPPSALYGGGSNGLEIPCQIIDRAARLLRDGGVLVMEHAPSQGADLCAHARKMGYVQPCIMKDLTGRDRYLFARRPKMGDMNVYPASEAAQPLQEAAQKGELVVIPTDTVYGIGADPRNAQAVSKLLAAKGRTGQMPPPVLVSALEDWKLVAASMSPKMMALARAFWPGALTLILPAGKNLGWDTEAKGGTVAVRVPGLAQTRELLKLTGPLAVTSANLHGDDPAQNVSDAQGYFGEEVAIYVDEGPTPGPVPSTIVSQRGEEMVILRHGVIPEEELARVWESA